MVNVECPGRRIKNWTSVCLGLSRSVTGERLRPSKQRLILEDQRCLVACHFVQVTNMLETGIQCVCRLVESVNSHCNATEHGGEREDIRV
jgi:hypothetical protein